MRRLLDCSLVKWQLVRNYDVTKVDDVRKRWLLMKKTCLKGSKRVCGMTNGPPTRS